MPESWLVILGFLCREWTKIQIFGVILSHSLHIYYGDKTYSSLEVPFCPFTGQPRQRWLQCIRLCICWIPVLQSPMLMSIPRTLLQLLYFNDISASTVYLSSAESDDQMLSDNDEIFLFFFFSLVNCWEFFPAKAKCLILDIEQFKSYCVKLWMKINAAA